MFVFRDLWREGEVEEWSERQLEWYSEVWQQREMVN